MEKNTRLKSNIIIIIVIMILMSTIILSKPLNNLDEVWNFNFAKNVADGRLPYKDFNMVQTPLLPIICALFLKIFGTELIVMRILGIAVCTGIFFVIYKIMESLKINKNVSWAVTLGIYFLFYDIFCIDYNFVTLLIVLIAIYIEIKSQEENKNILHINFKKDIGLGILIGSTIVLKQTTGLVVSIAFIFYKILICSNKEDFKRFAKILSARLIGVIVPLIIFVIYLLINNILNEFIDYTISGITTFSNNMPYQYLIKEKNIISALSILVPVSYLYMFFKTIVRKVQTIEDKNIFILYTYSVATFAFAFPISDKIHFLFGSTVSIIAISYIIYIKIKNIIKDRIKNKNIILYIKEYIKAFLILITICIAFYSIVNYSKSIKKQEYLNHFKYVTGEIDTINLIGDFIKEEKSKGKKVYMLDSSAALYMIPIDIYNKNYDMFLIGNLGARGEEGQIEDLSKEENCIVLILNRNYSKNWQNPNKVTSYITENWHQIGDIDKFEIFEKE